MDNYNGDPFSQDNGSQATQQNTNAQNDNYSAGQNQGPVYNHVGSGYYNQNGSGNNGTYNNGAGYQNNNTYNGNPNYNANNYQNNNYNNGSYNNGSYNNNTNANYNNNNGYNGTNYNNNSYNNGYNNGYNTVQNGNSPSFTTYMILSIVVAVFCSRILGIIAVVFTVQGNNAYKIGDFATHDEKFKNARILMIIGAVIGGIVFFFQFIIGFLGALI